MAFWDFFTGTPEKREQVSRLTPSQQKIQQQLEGAAQNRGAGGAFGESSDYFRDLLSNDSADFNAFAAPEMRRFNEQTIPGIAEQFAGMGAGGLSSSGFQNAAVGAGTDLSERLGSIRAGLRMQGAQGLQNIGNQSLQQNSDWQTTQPGSEGLLSQALPLLGTAAGFAIGGPFGASIGGGLGQMGQQALGNKGSSSPYGNSSPGRVQLQGGNSGGGTGGYKGSFGGQLPKFGAK